MEEIIVLKYYNTLILIIYYNILLKYDFIYGRC